MILTTTCRAWVTTACGFLSIGLAAVAQTASTPAVLLPPEQNRYALLIGVDGYDDQGITPLDDPAKDVDLLQQTLIQNAGFNADNITVLSKNGNSTHRPTRTNILKALSKIKRNVPEDGNALLLVMFAGHGITSNGEGYLLPQDAASSADPQLVALTSLSIRQLTEGIVGTHAKQTIILLDACRNDPEGGSHSIGDNKLTDDFKKDFGALNSSISASLVLFATAVGERAYVDPDRKLGFFTEVLVEGLQGANADANGDVTLASLLDYVQSEVPKRVDKQEMLAAQKPFYSMEGYKPANLIIATRRGTPPPPLPQPMVAPAPLANLTPDILSASVRLYAPGGVDEVKRVMSQHSIWLDLPEQLLSQVQTAKYTLDDPTFKPHSTIRDNSPHLMFRVRAWGCVDSATVEVQLADGSKVAAKFNECKAQVSTPPPPGT